MMNLFADTSNWNLIVLLEKDNKIIDSYIKRGTKKVSDIMVDSIKELLSKNKISIKDIKNVYITKGPGSYTGVRIALTMARTLKTLDDKYQIYTIDSLLYQAGKKNVISVLDARGKKVYVGVYENGHIIQEPEIIETSKLVDVEEKYDGYEIKQDYQDMNFEKNFLELKDEFELVNKVDDLKPIYLKDAIQN